MGKKLSVKVGDTFQTKNWGEIVVVNIDSWNKISVRFPDGYVGVGTSQHVKTGAVRNPMQPNVFGVGFMGVGAFRTSTPKGGNTPTYRTWKNMLNRCYGEDQQETRPTYMGCTVCDEWLNFQNFAEWYEKQDGFDSGWHLDKDLTVSGNKVYSPKTCCLVPREINNLLTNSKSVRGKLPIGVHWNKGKEMYETTIHEGNGARYLGSFVTAESAFSAYKEVKENYVKVVANEYKDRLPAAIYDNLMNYTVSITD